MNLFKKELLSGIEKIDDNNTSFILYIFDNLNTQLSMLQVEINENLNGTRNNIDNEVTNIIETVRSDIVSAADGRDVHDELFESRLCP